jgi:hypothetical protein
VRSGMRIKRVWLSSRPASRSRLMRRECDIVVLCQLYCHCR